MHDSLLGALAVLIHRAGGRVTITEEERRLVEDKLVVIDDRDVVLMTEQEWKDSARIAKGPP